MGQSLGYDSFTLLSRCGLAPHPAHVAAHNSMILAFRNKQNNPVFPRRTCLCFGMTERVISDENSVPCP